MAVLDGRRTVSLLRTVYDAHAVPDALLVAFKAWARIDHDDDDDALRLNLARVVDLLERQFGIAIAPQEWAWLPLQPRSPASARFGSALPALGLPVRGVADFTATRGAEDVTDEYEIEGAGALSGTAYDELRLVRAGGILPGDTLLLTAGVTVDTVDALTPALVDLLLRYGLYLWENRESGSAATLADVPDWVNRAWATFWTPRC